MTLVRSVHDAIWKEYNTYKDVMLYINKWHRHDDFNWQNFIIHTNDKNNIDLLETLHSMDGETLLKVAIDLGVDTPDFIPSIPVFKNELKSEYTTAYDIFTKAFKQAEADPSLAIGLANSALESIIKEILKDEKLKSKISKKETLYQLASTILKEFNFLDLEHPAEIKKIGNSLLTISQKIEDLRSQKTTFHGKTEGDYLIKDSLYAYLVINSVTTVGLFLNSYYKTKYQKPKSIIEDDDLPF